MLEMRCIFRSEPPDAGARTRFFLMLSKRTFSTSESNSSIAAITRDVLQRFDEHASQPGVHVTGHFALPPDASEPINLQEAAVPEAPYELKEGELGYTCVVEYTAGLGNTEVRECGQNQACNVIENSNLKTAELK